MKLQRVCIYYTTRKEGDALIAALEKMKAIPVIEGNKAFRAYEHEEVNFNTIEGLTELLKATPGIKECHVWHSVGSGPVKSPIRNQGGGFVQMEEHKTEFRVLLYTGDKIADITLPTLTGAMRAAFAHLGKSVPDAIEKAIASRCE